MDRINLKDLRMENNRFSFLFGIQVEDHSKFKKKMLQMYKIKLILVHE